jgi:hypothetical protein
MSQSKYNIGDVVKHKNGGWLAQVKAKKFDHAYGLCGMTKEKLWLYTLQDNAEGWEIMGSWGEPELTYPCSECQKMKASDVIGSLKYCDITKKCNFTS